MFHNLIIVGNLGRDPEMRYTPAGQPVTSFSVAVDDSYSKDGQRIKRTIWFRVSAWGKQAEVCNQYLTKGRKVLVEGRLVADDHGNPRVYEKSDGGHGASFEISANTVRFLSSAENGNGNGETAPAAEEEIPF